MYHVISRSNYHVRDKDETIDHGFVGIGYMPKYGENRLNVIVCLCKNKILVEYVFKKIELIKTQGQIDLDNPLELKYPHPNCTQDSFYLARCYVKKCKEYPEADCYKKKNTRYQWVEIDKLDETEQLIVGILRRS